MTEINKVPLFGIKVSVTNYAEACTAVINAGRARQSFGATALAVHGLVEAMRDRDLAEAVNSLDLVTPDGQPVRWALNLLHKTRLPDRTCGTDLTLQVCKQAERENIPIYIFGSTFETCSRLVRQLERRYPRLQIAGVQPDRFREPSHLEDLADVKQINASGAGIVLVVRGCPRQERWVGSHKGSVNAAMLAVGAAADFLAGNLRRPPRWVQASGLEWLHRLCQEPRRLARRYAVTNTIFLLALAAALPRHWLRIYVRPVNADPSGTDEERLLAARPTLRGLAGERPTLRGLGRSR